MLSAEASQNAEGERRQRRLEMTAMCPSAGILMSAASVQQVSKLPLSLHYNFPASATNNIAADVQNCCSLAGY